MCLSTDPNAEWHLELGKLYLLIESNLSTGCGHDKRYDIHHMRKQQRHQNKGIIYTDKGNRETIRETRSSCGQYRAQRRTTRGASDNN